MSRELIRKLQEKRSRETAADLETKKNCTVMIPGVSTTSNLTSDQATRMFEDMVEKNPTRCVYIYENGSVVNHHEPDSIIALLSETTKLNRTFSGWKEFDYDVITGSIIGNSKEISMKDFFAQFTEQCAEQGYPLLSIDTTKSKLVERKFEVVGRTLSEAKIKIQEYFPGEGRPLADAGVERFEGPNGWGLRFIDDPEDIILPPINDWVDDSYNIGTMMVRYKEQESGAYHAVEIYRDLGESVKIQEGQELYWLFNTESEKVDAEQQMTDVEAKERNKSLKAGGEKTRWIKAEESREIKDAKLLESLTADDLQLKIDLDNEEEHTNFFLRGNELWAKLPNGTEEKIGAGTPDELYRLWMDKRFRNEYSSPVDSEEAVDDRPVVIEVSKEVWGEGFNGTYKELLDITDAAELMGVTELSFEEVLAKLKELGLGDKADEFLSEEDEKYHTVDTLSDWLIKKGISSSRDNTYNWGWWGPTLHFNFISEETSNDVLYSSGILFVYLHAGGDPRGNYYGAKAFDIEELAEDAPWYNNLYLTTEITTDKGKIRLDAEDSEAYHWNVVEDETGVLEVEKSYTEEELSELLDFETNGKNMYEACKKPRRKNRKTVVEAKALTELKQRISNKFTKLEKTSDKGVQVHQLEMNSILVKSPLLTEGMIKRLAEKAGLTVVNRKLESWDLDKTYLLVEDEREGIRYAISSTNGLWYNEDNDVFGPEQARTIYDSLTSIPFVAAEYEQEVFDDSPTDPDIRYYENEDDEEAFASVVKISGSSYKAPIEDDDEEMPDGEVYADDLPENKKRTRQQLREAMAMQGSRMNIRALQNKLDANNEAFNTKFYVKKTDEGYELGATLPNGTDEVIVSGPMDEVWETYILHRARAKYRFYANRS